MVTEIQLSLGDVMVIAGVIILLMAIVFIFYDIIKHTTLQVTTHRQVQTTE